MKILITGFDPFGGERLNASWEAVRLLPDRIADAAVIKVQVPTTFAGSFPMLRDAIEQHDPDVVVNVGQAGGADAIRIERVAINIDDARIADNGGDQPVDRAIHDDGPAAYFSSLPIRDLVQAIDGAGVPATISDSAGTFVCNHLFYEACAWASASSPRKRAGFIHVPFLPEQVVDRPDTPSMSVDSVVRGLSAALEALTG